MEVILIIKQVNKRHFMKYNLKASNQKGQNSTVITLVNSGKKIINYLVLSQLSLLKLIKICKTAFAESTPCKTVRMWEGRTANTPARPLFPTHTILFVFTHIFFRKAADSKDHFTGNPVTPDAD